MKSYEEISKIYTPGEIAEAFVFPMSADSDERKEMLSAFKEIRKKYAVRQSEEDKLISGLLQQRFLIEDHSKGDNLRK